MILLVLTDLSRTLREEERRAWQRLVRVLGHEMNNSLAPIKSMAGSLETLLRREPMPADWKDDAQSGLKSIASRADSLSRFMQAYTRLAKLPPPQMEDVDLGELVQRVVNLEPRLKVQIVPGPKLQIRGRRGANRTGADQSRAQRGRCLARNERRASTIRWREVGDCVEVIVRDEGPGNHESDESFRSVFHHQTGRIRNRTDLEPADRGSAWRNVELSESQRSHRRGSSAALAALIA